MAYTSSLSENSLICAICLDVFTDPVTTSCGHNFCMTCIKSYRERKPCSSCPLCGKALNSEQDFNINTTIREITESIKRKRTEESEVSCDSCSKKMRMAVKSCLNCATSFCMTHLEPHKTAAKLMKHKLIKPVKNFDEYICKNHERPLELYCRDDHVAICQFCTESDHRNHRTVTLEKRSVKLLNDKKIDVEKKIQDKIRKIKEIKHSMRFNKQAKEKEIEMNVQFFKSIFDSSNAELLEQMEEKHKELERRGEELIREMEEEMAEMKRRQTDLEKLSIPLEFTQIISLMHKPKDTEHSNKISLDFHENGSIMRKTISELQILLDKKMRETVERELRSLQQYAVDVTLDPDTAHPKLALSDDGKKVWNAGSAKKIPDSPNRFDYLPCVLGKDGLSLLKFYFEVLVSGSDWDLGVAKESIQRKGDFSHSPYNGCWTVCLSKGIMYAANERVPMKKKPGKVGVFVDFEEGLVSFYDVKARFHLYTFTGQPFTEKLYPFFRCNNIHPIVITPVDSVE